MDETERHALVQMLHRQRAELRLIAGYRDAELEERAQKERMGRLLARLDDRQVHAFQEIEAALQRVADGTYGTCNACGQLISSARIQVLPATRLCVDCARRQEEPSASAVEEEAPRTGRIYADMSLTTERELESAIRDQVREDGRVDMEELRLVCRHGVVYLDGLLPSEEQHSILLQLVRDFVGLEEIVDRLRVTELLWEREERSKAEPIEEQLPRAESSETEDVVQSIEEGIEYLPPLEPPPEER